MDELLIISFNEWFIRFSFVFNLVGINNVLNVIVIRLFNCISLGFIVYTK